PIAAWSDVCAVSFATMSSSRPSHLGERNRVHAARLDGFAPGRSGGREPGRVVEAPPGLPRLSLGALVDAVVEDEPARLCRCPHGLVGHEPRAEPLLEHVGAAGGRLHATLLQAGSQLLEPGA